MYDNENSFGSIFLLNSPGSAAIIRDSTPRSLRIFPEMLHAELPLISTISFSFEFFIFSILSFPRILSTNFLYFSSISNSLFAILHSTAFFVFDFFEDSDLDFLITSSISSGLSIAPSLPKNFQPLNSGSLWEAVIIIPPSHSYSLTASSIIGVVAMLTSKIFPQNSDNALIMAFFILLPDFLVSVPIATEGLFPVFFESHPA